MVGGPIFKQGTDYAENRALSPGNTTQKDIDLMVDGTSSHNSVAGPQATMSIASNPNIHPAIKVKYS